MSRSFATLLLLVLFSALPSSATAQQGGSTTYVYDDNGRLHAVISPTGEAAVYEYDAAGNITAIRRLAANELSILSFSPHEGLPGDQVVFVGTGFGGGVTSVSFNGALATIVSVTANRIVTLVPEGATTGLVTITTPTGSVTTTTPFTIVGMRITPEFAALHFGESVQFSAEVFPSTFDQTVQWSVEGINGGNATVGTISPAGLYTAPNTRFSSLVIRATSVTDSSRFDEAQVRVSDPNDIQTVFAAAVSVQRADQIPVMQAAAPVTVRYNAVLEKQSGRAAPVTVQYGVDGGPRSALSSPLSVQYGVDGGPRSGIASPVSVERGESVKAAGIGPPVSVQYNTSVSVVPRAAASSTTGPYIQSISPTNVTRGATVTLTIDGVGLTGATTLRFITASGAIDNTFIVSNISVSGDGASMTVDVTVNAGAALGSRLVIVATPNGDSIGADLGVNRINVQ